MRPSGVPTPTACVARRTLRPLHPAPRADTASAAAPLSDDFDALVAAVRAPRPAAPAPEPPTPVADAASASAPAVAPRVPVARILGMPARAPGAQPVRLEVSVAERTLTAIQGEDTLLVAAAGVGTGQSLTFGARSWRFDTPAGRRRVLGKQAAPVWVPPEWHYVEVAHKRGFTLRHLRAGRPVALTGGRRLVVRGDLVGVVDRAGYFAALPADQEIVFDGVLYVPPFGTANRRIPGQLGAYRLELGDGFLIHGTPVESTVGTPSSHGCIRLAGDALAWVYAHVPVGAEVVIR